MNTGKYITRKEFEDYKLKSEQSMFLHLNAILALVFVILVGLFFVYIRQRYILSII